MSTWHFKATLKYCWKKATCLYLLHIFNYTVTLFLNFILIFTKLKLLKLTDIVKIQNIILTHNTLNGKAPTVFKNYFKIKHTHHQHETVNNLNLTYSIPKGSIDLPQIRTNSANKIHLLPKLELNSKETLYEIPK